MQHPEEFLEEYFTNEISLAKTRLIKLWSDLDTKIFETRDRVWIVKDFCKRVIWSPHGIIHFKRRRYQNKITKKYSYLLDEKLNLPKRKFILEKHRELALFYYRVFRSYKEVADNVFQGQVSKMSVHRFINEQPSEWGMKDFKCENDGILWINVDGFWLKKHKSKSSVELKNFLFFTGRKINRLKKWELQGRVIKTFIDESKEEMLEQLALIINQYEDVREIRLIADGARWIKKVAKEIGATYYIDKFHMRKALRDLLPKNLYLHGLKLISEDVSRKVLKSQLLPLIANPVTGELQKQQLRLLGYILNNHKCYIMSVSDQTTNGIEAIQAHYQGRYLKNQRKGFSLKTLKIVVNNLMSFENGSWDFKTKPLPNKVFVEGNGKTGKNVPVLNFGLASTSLYKTLQGIINS